MKKIIFVLLTLYSFQTFAASVHVSPELKIGPYYDHTQVVSGAGLQLGIAGVLNTQSIYVSYGHTSASFIHIDKDRLKTYRIGIQDNFFGLPDAMALQFELGWVEYEGERNIFGNVQHKDGSGASIASAIVYNINDNIAVRVGLEFNIIDKSNTFLESNVSNILATGLIFTF
ncbi:hypothetical protein [Shewanella sp. TC10]|uniref:hypothetical protein n=1 Tax=Shewanella sp. TC10 TaxID=1419739 RepID=UPI00129EAF93|nr:hypothetical protein [Shewanella sp. TC10]